MPHSSPDVSNKALITTATPNLSPSSAAKSAALHKLADDYYTWRNEQFPVGSSDAGLHTWDDRLTDYAPAKIAERAEHVRELLEKVQAMETANWAKDDHIDWLFFRAQLEAVDFDDRILQSTSQRSADLHERMQQRHLLTPEKGIRHAAETRARRDRPAEAMPAMFAQGEKNLQNPVKLFAHLAIASARSIDPLFNDSLMTLANDLPAERMNLL